MCRTSLYNLSTLKIILEMEIVMRKLLLILLMFVIMSIPVTYAGTREEMLNDMGKYVEVDLGKNNKGYYKDESFDFSQIKNITIITSVQKGNNSKLTDAEIITQSETIVKDKFNENFNRYLARTFDDALTEYKRLSNVIGTNDSETDAKSAWKTYFFSNTDTIIHIEAFAYNQTKPFANVAMVFTVYNNGKEVLCYKDFRLNVQNSSKEGVFNRIAESFVEKVDKEISNSRNKKRK